MPSRSNPGFDEFYVLRLDSSGRPRGARFAKLQDRTASAAIDIKSRVLILQPRSVCRLAMNLPTGRLHGGKLVMPRIRRDLYDKISKAADLAEARLAERLAKAEAQRPIISKESIRKANAVLARIEKSRAASSC